MSVFFTWTKFGPSAGVGVAGALVAAVPGAGFAPMAAPWVAGFILSLTPAVPFGGSFGDAFCSIALALTRAPIAVAASRNLRMS
jgi:hypothetical protein